MNENSFKWDAELYQKSSQMQYNLGLMAIDRLKPKSGEDVLEIGSGNAMLSIDIAKQINPGKLVGIELSEDQCEQANQNVKEHDITNIQIYCMNAMDLDCENKFRAVFSNSAIHWIKDLESMYQKIYNALVPNGRIMIQTGLKELNKLFQFSLQLFKFEEFSKYFKDFKLPWSFLSKRNNERILQKVGFNNVNVEVYNFNMKFDDEESAWNYVKAAALVPFLSILPVEEHNIFLDKAKRKYFEINNKNPLELRMKRVFLSAIK